MSIEGWTEAQLADFIQQKIQDDRKNAIKELPQLPSRPEEIEPKHDDLLIFRGQKWIPYTMPAARVWCSTTQSVGPGAAIAVTFDTERFDTEVQAPGLWEPTTFPQRLTAFQAGVYLVVGRVRAEIGATGLKVQIRKTDRVATQTIVDEERLTNAGGGTQHWGLVTAIIQLQSTEYVELMVGHDALASVVIETEADRTPIFSMTRIA